MKKVSTTGLFLLIFCLFTNFTNAQIATTSRFVVPLDATQQQTLQNLVDAKIISNVSDLNNFATITPGAYKLYPGMNLQTVTQILTQKPYMVWVVIPPGLRKEEVANILASNLSWTKFQKNNFLKYTNLKYNYIEGIYFPDTYLIPTGEDPFTTYKRFVAKFNEKFANPLLEFNSQGFPWIKALTLASIVQREAAGTEDMPLIDGILLNRINQKIPLGVDSTLQYVRGDKNAILNKNPKTATTTTAYWAPISVLDKKLVSNYNTYTHLGLPPHPISNPGIDAINSVLNPATTTCLYYLHDNNRQIHCADTYAQHLQNIQTYLK